MSHTGRGGFLPLSRSVDRYHRDSSLGCRWEHQPPGRAPAHCSKPVLGTMATVTKCPVAGGAGCPHPGQLPGAICMTKPWRGGRRSSPQLPAKPHPAAQEIWGAGAAREPSSAVFAGAPRRVGDKGLARDPAGGAGEGRPRQELSEWEPRPSILLEAEQSSSCPVQGESSQARTVGTEPAWPPLHYSLPLPRPSPVPPHGLMATGSLHSYLGSGTCFHPSAASHSHSLQPLAFTKPFLP